MTARSSSRDALERTRVGLDEVLADASAEQAVALAVELFAVVALLDRQVRLRRVLADASSPPQARTQVVADLLAALVSPQALRVIDQVVGARWSSATDLVDGLEQLAVRAAAAGAELDGVLGEVEDELFQFGRLVRRDAALREALGDPALPGERKAEVVASLLTGRARPVTTLLAERAALAPRGHGMAARLEDFAELAAARRSRLIARVRVAVPLTSEQGERLRAALSTSYGHPIQLNVEVSPDVLGGVEVIVGDEVVDGTLATRLDAARRRLAG